MDYNKLIERGVLACQSTLVEAFMLDDLDDIENLCHDPSDWTVERCREVLDDYPQPDPWHMDAETCVDLLLETGHDANIDEHIDDLRAAVIASMNAGDIDGLEDWREAVRELPPQEIYEWWLVTKSLAEDLAEIGEPVLRNDYGNWWGRTATGQAIRLDDTFQRLAKHIEERNA